MYGKPCVLGLPRGFRTLTLVNGAPQGGAILRALQPGRTMWPGVSGARHRRQGHGAAE